MHAGVVDDEDTIGDPGSLLVIVGDMDGRCPQLAQKSPDIGDQALAQLPIEGGERLIQE